jgi:hypothetical protein
MNMLVYICFVYLHKDMKSHDSSVGIVLDYGLDDWGSRFDSWRGPREADHSPPSSA